MNDQDRLTAQQAIIAELKKKSAEVTAARDKILATLPAGCLEELDRKLEATQWT